jgi:hypothetical protein
VAVPALKMIHAKNIQTTTPEIIEQVHYMALDILVY